MPRYCTGSDRLHNKNSISFYGANGLSLILTGETQESLEDFAYNKNKEKHSIDYNDLFTTIYFSDGTVKERVKTYCESW